MLRIAKLDFPDNFSMYRHALFTQRIPPRLVPYTELCGTSRGLVCTRCAKSLPCYEFEHTIERYICQTCYAYSVGVCSELLNMCYAAGMPMFIRQSAETMVSYSEQMSDYCALDRIPEHHDAETNPHLIYIHDGFISCSCFVDTAPGPLVFNETLYYDSIQASRECYSSTPSTPPYLSRIAILSCALICCLTVIR